MGSSPSRPSAEEHRNTHSDRAGHRDAGAEQRGGAAHDADGVTPRPRAIVVSQQEVRQAERERGRHGDLEPEEDVDAARAEDDEREHRRGGEPPSDAQTSRGRPDQEHSGVVTGDPEELVGPVGGDTPHLEDGSVGDRREHHVVAEPGVEQRAGSAQVTPEEEVPLVEEEPLVAPGVPQHGHGQGEDQHEEPEGAVVPRRRHQPAQGRGIPRSLRHPLPANTSGQCRKRAASGPRGSTKAWVGSVPCLTPRAAAGTCRTADSAAPA